MPPPPPHPRSVHVKMAPADWLSPWRPPLLLLILTLCFLSEATSTTPFPKDLEPISVVGSDQSYHFPGFQGLLQDNDTLRLGLDFQRMLRINHMLYIAARDHVFAVNLTTASEKFIPQLKLTWKSKDVSKCTVRGKNSDECYNYVKVLVPRNDETLFACGTNAFNPTCRNYKMTGLEQVGEEVVGQARCPFESGQSNVGLFAGGDFYSATMTDFLASDAVIYRSLGDGRPVLRTVKYDSKWLREPHFLHAIDYGNYVYFFLSEIAVEYTALGKVVFSRVARVCKNDNGGSPRVLERYWTSFLKARLNCSVPGDSFFYFDVLQSLTNVLQINQRPAVVGVFTTQANSIPGSAVCAFYMDDIEKVFNGKFKEQRTSDSSWTPVPDEQVPRPRPGTCAGDGPAADYKSSVQFPDETLTFIKSYPLMDEAVPSVNDRPVFTRTSSRSKLTQIVVDVSAGPNKDRTVMFLGSDDGRVLKVLASTHANDSFRSKLLEDIDVYNPSKSEDRRVLGLELDKDHHALFVGFSSCVIRVPLSRCPQHGACKKSCLASRDPYCIWLRTGSCANMAPGYKAGFEQDIEGDHSSHPDSCHGEINYQSTAAITTRTDRIRGVRRLPDLDQRPGANVHYTLLIACVLVAFFLGAILSGFLVSCYCSRSAAQRARKLGKDPEASLPHALSLRSLAKLNGLLDGQPKEDKLDMSTPKMYSSFIPNGRAEPHLHTPVHQGLQLGDPDLNLSQSLSQADGELSGLPTPDSTPELPIKNMKALRHHQYEKNQNCNNAKDNHPKSAPSCSGSNLGFMAVVGNTLTSQAFPFPHHHGNSLSNGAALGAGTSSTSLHLPEERKISNDERAAAGGEGGGGGGGAPHHHRSQQSLPQTVVDVSALDELLKHIHEVSASGTGGIKVLTSTSSSSLFPGASKGHHPNPHHPLHHSHHSQTRTHHYNHSHHHSNHHNNNNSSTNGGSGGGRGGGGHHHQKQIPETETLSYYNTSTLPRDGLPKCIDPPPQNTSSATSSSSSSSSSSSNNPTSSTSIPSSSSSSSSTPLQQQVIPERPGGSGVSVTRHHSQRHSLIKMGSGGGGGGGAVPRHHSFNQRGAQHAHFLARMNTNSSSNGPPSSNRAANTNANNNRASQKPSVASTCLTRQHSYSEGPHMQRAGIIRRTVSLKPQVPPKPLFLPNTAASPVAEAGKYKY
ncbi:semaphorin-6D-like [Xyrichtys novacula]|uniref:Semaphorin-2A n=1 Tax=Xyrichtys novacula TaxID=13765 RepID=A0AAV1HF60_XYRNO|nr:semaphorin-6D-like [Xyrichtys novacula]